MSEDEANNEAFLETLQVYWLTFTNRDCAAAFGQGLLRHYQTTYTWKILIFLLPVV